MAYIEQGSNRSLCQICDDRMSCSNIASPAYRATTGVWQGFPVKDTIGQINILIYTFYNPLLFIRLGSQHHTTRTARGGQRMGVLAAVVHHAEVMSDVLFSISAVST